MNSPQQLSAANPFPPLPHPSPTPVTTSCSSAPSSSVIAPSPAFPFVPPASPESILHRALQLWNSSQPLSALQLLSPSFAANPHHLPTRLLLAEILMSTGDTASAQQLLDSAPPEQLPSYDLQLARTKLLLLLGQNHAAIQSAHSLLALKPSDPTTHSLLSRALRRTGQLERSLHHAHIALSLLPHEPTFHNNLAVVLAELGQFKQALHHYHRAWQLNPHYASAKSREGMLRLLLGDWPQAWPLYEFRLGPDPLTPIPPSPAPLWLPDQPLTDKTLLIRAEQGLGDNLQFLRFLPLLAARGARILLETPAPLLRLLQQSPLTHPHTLIPVGQPFPPHDLQLPLLSLGHRLQLLPTPHHTLPSPYLSRPNFPSGKNPASPRIIAFAYAGNPLHSNQHARSIPLQTLSKLFSIKHIHFVCLQKNPTPDDSQILSSFPNVSNPAPTFLDLADTADALLQTDLLITVDTSIAHLAGALGHPTWLLLPKIPDWRWGLNSESNLWYSNTRLVRQTTYLNWDEVIDRIYHELLFLTKN